MTPTNKVDVDFLSIGSAEEDNLAQHENQEAFLAAETTTELKRINIETNMFYFLLSMLKPGIIEGLLEPFQ